MPNDNILYVTRYVHFNDLNMYIDMEGYNTNLLKITIPVDEDYIKTNESIVIYKLQLNDKKKYFFVTTRNLNQNGIATPKECYDIISANVMPFDKLIQDKTLSIVSLKKYDAITTELVKFLVIKVHPTMDDIVHFNKTVYINNKQKLINYINTIVKQKLFL